MFQGYKYRYVEAQERLFYYLDVSKLENLWVRGEMLVNKSLLSQLNEKRMHTCIHFERLAVDFL